MTKNVTLRRPKLLDLDQLLLWENNLDNSLFSDNPIFYTAEQIEEFLNSDQDIFLDRQIRFIIDSSGFPVGCVDLFKYDMVNSRAGVGIFIDEKFRNMGIATKALSQLKSICIKIILFQIYTSIFYIPIKLVYSFLKGLDLLKTGLKKIGLELKTQC